MDIEESRRLVKKQGEGHNNWIQEENNFSDSSDTFASIFIRSTKCNQELGRNMFFTLIEACPSPFFLFVVVAWLFNVKVLFLILFWGLQKKAYSNLWEEAMATTPKSWFSECIKFSLEVGNLESLFE